MTTAEMLSSMPVVISGLALLVSGIACFFGPFAQWRRNRRESHSRLTALLLELYRSFVQYDRATTYLRSDGRSVREYEMGHKRVVPQLKADLTAQKEGIKAALHILSTEAPTEYVNLRHRLGQIWTTLYAKIPTTEEYGDWLYKETVAYQDVMVAAIVDDLAATITTRIRDHHRWSFRVKPQDKKVLQYIKERQQKETEFVNGMKRTKAFRLTIWSVQDTLRRIAAAETKEEFEASLPALRADWHDAKRYGSTLHEFLGGYEEMLCTEFGVTEARAAEVARELYAALEEE